MPDQASHSHGAVPQTLPHRLVIPPRLPVPAAEPSSWQFLRAVRTNALLMWPEQAYLADVLEQSFLGRRLLLVNTPDAIHHILAANASNYRRSPASLRILRPVIGDGLLLSTGEAWRHQRRTIAPALSPRGVPMLVGHIAAAAQNAATRLQGQTGDPVDLLVAMQLLALEIAARSMFSLEIGQDAAVLRRLLEQFSWRLGRPTLLDMLLPPAVPTLRDIARARFRRRWTHFMDGLISRRMAETPSETPRDLLDLLRAARDPETGAAFSREQLRDQVSTMLVAGHETTALTLFWAVYLLALAPDEQARVAAEVSGHDLEPEAAAASLSALIRTRAVIDETLRLYPPAFFIVRQAIKPDRCAGLAIPRGMVVMIAPWVLHRHHRLWPDPDAFDPSRFLPNAPPPPRFAYLPFGAGPRVCVGATFALAEVVLALAILIRRFRVTLADGEPVVPVAVVTTQPNQPARFLLQLR